MHKDSFDFVYNAEGDYYDLVVDKKIQKVVEELKALSHDVLIRYLTYWSEAIDSRKYVMRQGLQLFYDFLYFLVYNQIVIIAFGVVDEIE